MTEGWTCCCCFPIKCGVELIAASIVIITFVQFLEIFYQTLNDQIAWWYVLVGVGITIPLVVGFGLAIYFFAEDYDGTRVGLQSAVILTIVSVCLLALWNSIYFTWLYDSDTVTTGNDGIGFVTITVKQQVVFSLWIAFVISAFFMYYACIVAQYKNLYRKAEIDAWVADFATDDEKKALLVIDPKNPALQPKEGEAGDDKEKK